MFLVAIGACDNAEAIKTDLYKFFEKAKEGGLDVIYQDYCSGSGLFINCGVGNKLRTCNTEKKALEEFRYMLSNALADVIIDHYELRLLKKIAKSNFFYLNESERSSVVSNACKLLGEEMLAQPGTLFRATRKNRITRSIFEYLDSAVEFNIEGFVNFRLNQYLNELNDILERALELFVAEREYNEFIRLLRYFVEIQECKVDTVHLFQSQDGRYMLCDEDRNHISSEYYDELKTELTDEAINYDDLLISTLITVSPQRIVIHDVECFKNKELVQTIMNVFTDRITLCGSNAGEKGTNNNTGSV